MAKNLVIVESPTKAKTLSRFLGDEYVVESSIGHVRDLPSKAAEIPATYRKKSWARLGVNIEDNFKPLYIIPTSKKKQVKKLKDLLSKAQSLYIATDEDREGEAIAWHLTEVLKPKVPVHRMVFHEITKKAVGQALASPRGLDTRLVEAQEARRILDRLFGYEVSPVLWKKVRPKLSAGRVQSVATRLIVGRELERIAFCSANYWSIEADLSPVKASTPSVRHFGSVLIHLGDARVAIGKDFDPSNGELISQGVIRLDRQKAHALSELLKVAPLQVSQVVKKPFRQKPAPPFITSTLQQEAGRKLSYTAQRTMRLAQQLYENGYITYMRTDATILSEEAITAARGQIQEMYGDSYLPNTPRSYQKKVKGAQEAHEAIRPAGEAWKTPEQLKQDLSQDAVRLYELIWKRTIACQMRDAQGERTRVRICAKLKDLESNQSAEFADEAILQASGKVITLPGFLRAYVEGSDDPEAELSDKEVILPAMQEGDALHALRVDAREHSTKPPARYTEASLVKELETLGIGRPSTYASIIQTIQDRGYVWKRSGALMPTLTALAVTRLLEKHFDELVNYDFTAKMESDLDAISNGEQKATPWLKEFYFGNRKHETISDIEARNAKLNEVGIKVKIEKGIEEIDAREICSHELGEVNGESVVARVGRYGPYLQIGDSEERASIPEELPIDELDLKRALDLIREAKTSSRVLGNHPDTNEIVQLRSGRYGPYVQLGENNNGKNKKTKPKMASVWPNMDLQTLDLDDALFLLSFPRSIGQHPEHGVEITADYGQYGPYISMEVNGKRESRSLDDHEQLRTITLDQALALFAQPKKRRRQGPSQTLIAQLAKSPITGKPIQIKNGRFGPYVTDGQVNASIRAGRDPATITFDDALELIAAREQRMREQGKDPRSDSKEAPATTRKPTRAKKKAASKKTTKKRGKKPTKKTVKKAVKKAARKAARKTSNQSGSKPESSSSNSSAKSTTAKASALESTMKSA